MARTALTVIGIKGSYEPAATAVATCTFTAADASNGNSFVATGREVVLVRNTHATDPKTVTVTSVANAKNRTGHITGHSIAAGVTKVLPFFKPEGWASGGVIALDGEDNNIAFSVLRLP